MKKLNLVRVLMIIGFTTLAAGCGNNNNNNIPATTTTTTTTTTTGTSGPYEQAVLADAPIFYWLLNETSGSTFAEQVNSDTANVGPFSTTAVQHGISSPIVNDGNTGINLLSGLIYTDGLIPKASAQTTFSLEFWFQTAPLNAGGRIIGFGSSQKNSSASSDRQVYMDTSGRLYFGINDGAKESLTERL